MSYKSVHASRGNVVQAEQIAALYEQRKVYHVGGFTTLEDQMCAFTSDFDRGRAGYSQVILIPNALAEASNLLRQTRDPDRSFLMATLRVILDSCSERYVVSKTAATEATFVRLGLTDAALISAARVCGDLFSVDSKLCIAAAVEGINALNFAHIYDAAFG